MARSSFTRKEEKEYHSPQLRAKAMRLGGDEVPTTVVVIGIEKADNVLIHVVQIQDQGTDLAPRIGTLLSEVLEFSPSD